MRTSVIGYPRVGALRELKFAVEKYHKKELTKEELQATASKLREEHWKVQKNNGIDFITCQASEKMSGKVPDRVYEIVRNVSPPVKGCR